MSNYHNRGSYKMVTVNIFFSVTEIEFNFMSILANNRTTQSMVFFALLN
jgi:hypothetical protein